jgi:hypothetical protein
METNVDKKIKRPYNPKYYKKRENPVGRPKGVLGGKQKHKRVRYDIIYGGKKYYATSLPEAVLIFGISRQILDRHVQYCHAMQNNDEEKIKTFSAYYPVIYQILKIYSNFTDPKTYDRGVLDENHKHITKEEFDKLHNQSI